MLRPLAHVANHEKEVEGKEKGQERAKKVKRGEGKCSSREVLDEEKGGTGR